MKAEAAVFGRCLGFCSIGRKEGVTLKLGQVIAYVDDIKPNVFSDETKTAWLNECEGLVQTEVMLLAIEEVIQYDFETNEETELLAKAPHDKIYWTYLTALIDFANGEYNKYQNTMQLFNTYFGEYMRWYALHYRPADGECVEQGYYLSAYGLALKHGFEGTEEEWIASLKGEKGDSVDMQYDAAAQMLQWKREPDTVWNDLLDITDLQGEVVAQTLEAAQASATQAEASASQAATSAANAAGAVSEHNGATDAHGSLFAGKADANHTHGNATTEAAGFMSGADKEKLDGVVTNLENGSAVGAVRGIGTTAEDSSYTMGEYAFAEGINTRAGGDNSHAEGQNTTANGLAAHAEGIDTLANNDYAHAEGANTQAIGAISHAEGSNTKASGQNSHVEGNNTIANSKSQHVQGEYNIEDTAGSATRRI